MINYEETIHFLHKENVFIYSVKLKMYYHQRNKRLSALLGCCCHEAFWFCLSEFIPPVHGLDLTSQL